MGYIPQCDRVLMFIDRHGAITQADADTIKVKRLSARIYDLRKRGEKIVADTIYGKNEYGPWHCACYRRGENAEQDS